MQVMYLGRAPRTKETLPDFLKWCRVTRHPLVFRGLTGSQRTPRFGASQLGIKSCNTYSCATTGMSRESMKMDGRDSVECQNWEKNDINVINGIV